MEHPPCHKLMRHQEDGVAFLLEHGSGLLGFEQGLGKTLVAIESFRRLSARGSADLLLVVCPNSLKRNWAQEIEKFAPSMQCEIVAGSARERREQLGRTTAAVVVINYESARVEITAIRALLSRRRAVLVLDESHMAKNRRSLTSTATRHFGRLAPYRWLLTGTPVTNSAEDIHTQVELVANASPLGSPDAFRVRYEAVHQDESKQRELAKRISPFLLRRKKEECLDLPPKTFIDLHVTLPMWQRELYDKARDRVIDDVRGMSSTEFRAFAGTALTRLLRLSQIASNPALVLPGESRQPAKVRELDLLLEELVGENGRKVIIWSYYVRTIRQLLERYAAYGAAGLYGEIPGEDRQAIANRFQTENDIRILVANPAAAGTGFTLTAATYSVYETLTWRYDLYAQSQDRNHRIGQSMPVTYLRLLAEDTIDEVIEQSLARKAVLAGAIVGDGRVGLDISAMTADAFCEMVRSNRLPL